MNIIAVDVETTGLHPEKHSIVSIGAVNTGKPEQTFYIECNAWPGAEIDAGALKVNGFSKFDIIDNSEKRSEAYAMTAFLQWTRKIDDKPFMLGQNVNFDSRFVDAAFARAGIPNPFNFRTLDLHTIAAVKLYLDKGELPPRDLSLNKILVALGLPPEPDPHNALTGAQCAYECADKLL